MSCHAEFLRVAAEDVALARGVRDDFRRAGLTAREVALLELVEAVTLAPFTISAAHWDGLRAHGWSDAEIARAALGSAHFNYLNRVADGVGIRLDFSLSGALGDPEPGPPAGATAERSPTRGEATPEPPPPARAGRFYALDQSAVSMAADLTAGLAPEDAPELVAALAFAPSIARLVREWRGYHFTGTAALPAALRARLALYCSTLAWCEPSARWARRRAERLDVRAAGLDALARGTPDAADAREQALFEQARRLALEPALAREEHVQALRALGLDDRDVLQFTMLVAYLSFEHRAVHALGVVIER